MCATVRTPRAAAGQPRRNAFPVAPPCANVHAGRMDMPDLGAIAPFIAVGFAAQIVDGALGMAFGVISSTLLISLGVPPSAASAGIHAVETVTTAVSGTSHALHKNVDWRLFWRLAIPGVIGGALGAYGLTQIPAADARPFILAYLSIIAVLLIVRGLTKPHRPRPPRVVAPLGFVGGFLDAAGGGGWGPIVTGNLLAQGGAPRQVVGTVSLVEFFVTLTISATFLLTLQSGYLTEATLGLLIGGVAAAPLGAVLVKRVSPRPLMVAVGVVLLVTSGLGIWRALG